MQIIIIKINKPPPTRIWSEGGVWGVCCCVTTAHRLAFAARVGGMGAKRPHQLAFGARVGSVGELTRKNDPPTRVCGEGGSLCV